jgi:hypothetical protein
MQLPRVVIAVIFIAIGLLIAVPAVWNTVQADGAPTSSGQQTTPAPSPTGTRTSPSPTGGARTSPSPTGTRTSPSPTRPRPTPTRTTPSPTRTPTPAVPAQPLQVSIGSVSCPARTVQITIRNTGQRAEDYAIERNDGAPSDPGRIPAGQTRTERLRLTEDRRTTIQVTWRNQPMRTRMTTANCSTATPTPDETDEPTEEPTDEPSPEPTATPDDELPRTGPEDNLVWARAATGGAAMVTGVIIFWYGGIWPRRRDKVFGGKES